MGDEAIEGDDSTALINDKSITLKEFAVRYCEPLVVLSVASVNRVPSYVWKFLVTVAFFAFGTVFYNKYENWDIVDCLFFEVYSVTTVGYGSLYPTTNNSAYNAIFISAFIN